MLFLLLAPNHIKKVQPFHVLSSTTDEQHCMRNVVPHRIFCSFCADKEQEINKTGHVWLQCKQLNPFTICQGQERQTESEYYYLFQQREKWVTDELGKIRGSKTKKD